MYSNREKEEIVKGRGKMAKKLDLTERNEVMKGGRNGQIK